VVEVLRERLAKGMHPAALAAYVLDPIHLQHNSSQGTWSPPTGELDAEQLDCIKELLLRITEAKEGAERQALADEWSAFKLAALPAELTGDAHYLTRREQQADGSVQIRPLQARLGWWEKVAGKRFPWLVSCSGMALPWHDALTILCTGMPSGQAPLALQSGQLLATCHR
jgi:hypothetical protein